jgi:hypothetical protein
MRARLESMRRMTALYAAVEDMHSTELQQIAAAVTEAQQAIDSEQSAILTARLHERGALLTGDHESWIIAGNQQVASRWRRQRLEQIRHMRERLAEVAREQFMTSCQNTEQMKQIVDDISLQLGTVEGRKMQAASDDRFLARTRWLDAKEKRENAEV